jgi:HNH endonuclease
MKLTLEELRERLAYDPADGVFRLTTGRCKGRPTGTVERWKHDTRITVRVDRVKFRGNRLAWAFMTGAWPTRDILHRDGDPLNIRFANLYEAPPAKVRETKPPRRKRLKLVLTFELLREMIEYKPQTGEFFWRYRLGPQWQYWNKYRAGEPAGRTQLTGRGKPYVFIRIFGRQYPAARIAWFYMTGMWPFGHVDHIDLDGSNNRYSNLRVANDSQNGANRTVSSRSKSGLKGVSFISGKWQADICIKHERIMIGRYATKEEAAQAYADAAYEAWGAFARSDVPPSPSSLSPLEAARERRKLNAHRPRARKRAA